MLTAEMKAVLVVQFDSALDLCKVATVPKPTREDALAAARRFGEAIGEFARRLGLGSEHGKDLSTIAKNAEAAATHIEKAGIDARTAEDFHQLAEDAEQVAEGLTIYKVEVRDAAEELLRFVLTYAPPAKPDGSLAFD
jgi:hypothetical protein